MYLLNVRSCHLLAANALSATALCGKHRRNRISNQESHSNNAVSHIRQLKYGPIPPPHI